MTEVGTDRADSRVASGPTSGTSGIHVGGLAGLEARLIDGGRSTRETLSEYQARSGYDSAGERASALIEAVDAAGLRGRGGAAFPTGIKLRSVAGQAGPRYLIANGEEGEPASIKDRWLLRLRPHLVLDGVLLAAEAVAAAAAWIYVSDAAAARSVAAALEELGETPLPIELFVVEAGYVAGEETAAVRAIMGGPAKPLDKPPRPFEAGIHAQPTLVANVETLANLPFISRNGSEAFRAVGTDASPGTFLFTLSGACRRPGLYEIPLGLPLTSAIEALGGVVGTPRGYLMGGFFGGLLRVAAGPVELAYDELKSVGSGLGCGAVIVVGEDDCPVAAAADVMSYFARENAKQCGACIRGTAAMRDVLIGLVTADSDHAQVERLRGWSVSLRGRGACGTLDGAAQLAASLLREFPDEVAEHVAAQCPRCSLSLAESSDTPFAVSLDS